MAVYGDGLKITLNHSGTHQLDAARVANATENKKSLEKMEALVSD
tara:strand:+ start:1669 stop:1803 length:135 start_codon:yes stop_codon:yes gene_type:complete